LHAAWQAGEVVPLFVLDPYFFDANRAAGWPHRMQFLLDSLHELQRALRARGSDLLVIPGKSVDVMPELVELLGADRVLAQRWVEPFARERDRRIALALGDRFELFEGETLAPPGLLRSGAGTPYSVFTPFARAFRQRVEIASPVAAPKTLPPIPADALERATARVVPIPTCADLGIERNARVQPGGERAANKRLRAFRLNALADYASDRDRMDRPGTSRLSADLKFGTLSPRQVWWEVERASPGTDAAEKYLTELIWREFSHSTLWDRPELLQEPFRADFRGFPYRRPGDVPALWEAWTEGRTGYPIVDAAARQLLEEGFVHNRARMISASFLTKHLLISYQAGEAHYMRYLTDGDWAQNNAGWQWSAGSGCDAQPYFRVFNPLLQGKRFDPEGDYVRRYVPELEGLPARHIHAPFAAPASVLEAAGVTLGDSYPEPVVDHKQARERFLELAKAHLRAYSQ
jgi:deoxyribodipyrimidine photo-lyase